VRVKDKPPQPIQLEPDDAERLIHAAEQGTLSTEDQKRVAGLIRMVLWLQTTLLETRIGLSRLRRVLFGAKTEKRTRNTKSDDNDGGDGENGGNNPPPDTDTVAQDQNELSSDSTPDSGTTTDHSPAEKPQETTKPRGHGRAAAAAYTGAETIFCPHDDYQVGDGCPLCLAGRLYRMKEPNSHLRFTGQPLALVVRYELERLRCSSCGAITAANMPPEAGRETYDISLKVNLAVAHYFLGLPFKRIEAFQSLVGMPLPDATQWPLVEKVADTAYVVVEHLKKVAADYLWVYQDDTGARILSLIRENRADPPPARKGMHTTALVFDAEGEPPICLYLTGRQHAGENLDDILAHRDSALAPIHRMADGLAANHTKKNESVESQCLTHGRRQFVDLEGFFPDECQIVIDAIGQVYGHDSHCNKKSFPPERRLSYHQTHSRPVMDELKAWMEKQFEDKIVEPNSRLGGAYNYLLKRWEGLTRFLDIAGAPLDNNTAERAIKMILRYRKNSLFYANEHGAHVGDILTSLIETCRAALINPLDYLTALMENRSAVFGNPGAWLPWNYRSTLDAVEEAPLLGHPPPVFGHPGQVGVTVPQ